MYFPFADLRANGPIDHHPLSPHHEHPVPMYVTDTASGGENHGDLDLHSVGDFPHRPVEWLWPGKIPIGKVTLLVGDPGLGKSLVALDVAARVTTGAAWPTQPHDSIPPLAPAATPDSAMTGGPARRTTAQPSPNPKSKIRNPKSQLPGSVLLLTTDDDVADTIRPRLEAHGANVSRVFFVPSLADLRHDFGKLEATLDRIPDCRLIVVDPVNAYVGPSDSHFHTIVRKVLAPLAKLAARKRIAILAVTHLRKRDGSAIQGATGSMGFVAAARTVWTICRDQDNPRRTLFLPVKNNLGPLGTGLAYAIESHPQFDAPVIRWESTAVTTSVEEAFRPAGNSRGPEALDRRNAGEWLKKALADGPHESWLVLREGKQNGFGERTLQRALHEIGGQTKKNGFLAGWWWSLASASPAGQTHPNQGVQPDTGGSAQGSVEKPVAFGETCRLRENAAKIIAGDRPPGDSPPDLASFATPPTIEESIRFFNRLDAQRKRDTQRRKFPVPNPQQPTPNNGQLTNDN